MARARAERREFRAAAGAGAAELAECQASVARADGRARLDAVPATFLAATFLAVASLSTADALTATADANANAATAAAAAAAASATRSSSSAWLSMRWRLSLIHI